MSGREFKQILSQLSERFFYNSWINTINGHAGHHGFYILNLSLAFLGETWSSKSCTGIGFLISNFPKSFKYILSSTLAAKP